MNRKCGCGFEAVNLIPDYEKNVARCPNCDSVLPGLKARDAICEDFSSLSPGDIVKRICMRGESKNSWNVEVKKIEEGKIVCEIVTDHQREVCFDKKTGVSLDGIDYGYLTLSGF